MLLQATRCVRSDVALNHTFELIQVLEDILINGVNQKDHFYVLLCRYFQEGGFLHLFDRFAWGAMGVTK